MAEEAMFGAGCFWGVEHSFGKLKGVSATAVGYSGGKTQHPDYKQVCNGDTHHAEVVHITFDPAVIPYRKLVEHFFAMHDPTQFNRQGPDYGTQYRSAIFTYSDEQVKAANEVKQVLETAKKYPKAIVTQIEPAQTFWRAEEYHQKYVEKTGRGACHV